MQRHQDVVPAFHPVRGPRTPRQCRLEMLEQRVDHRVAHEPNHARIDPFAREVGDGFVRVREEQRAHVVREDAVVLLGHAPVTAPKTRFDVGYGDLELHCRKGCGKRRVHIARDDEKIDRIFHQHRFNGHEGTSGLLGVRARPDPEKEIRFRKPELVEEDRRHLLVVVLSGMDQLDGERIVGRLEGTLNGRDLHEVRPRSDDESDGRHAAKHPIHADRLSGTERRAAATDVDDPRVSAIAPASRAPAASTPRDA